MQMVLTVSDHLAVGVLAASQRRRLPTYVVSFCSPPRLLRCTIPYSLLQYDQQGSLDIGRQMVSSEGELSELAACATLKLAS
jgi:hypothetical protein